MDGRIVLKFRANICYQELPKMLGALSNYLG